MDFQVEKIEADGQAADVQVKKTKRPVILTVNGKAEAVLLAAKEYEKIASAFNLLKLLMPTEEDIKNDRYKERRDFFREFKRDKKIFDQVNSASTR